MMKIHRIILTTLIKAVSKRIFHLFRQSYAFKGHHRYADSDAQSFIRERLAKTGQDRVVYFKHTEPDGRILSGNATLSGIVHGGGDAGERGNFEATITFNGLPDDSKSLGV